MRKNNIISKKYKYVDIVNRMLDTRWLAESGSRERSAEFTSYDRKSRHEDGKYIDWNANDDGGGIIEKYDDGSVLIAEMKGPGYISRIWSADAQGGHVKIYIDGEENPVIDLPFEDFFNCTLFNYGKLCYTTSKGKNCYVPITYNKSCRIVAEEGWGRFYHVNYTTLPEDSEVESLKSVDFTEDQAAALARVNEFFRNGTGTNPDGTPDADFEKYTLAAGDSITKSFDGKGALSGILVRVAGDKESTSENNVKLLKNLRIRAWWNGSEEADVDSPLGDFFACGYGFDRVKTLLLGAREDRTLYNYYYMPYLHGAVLEISNAGIRPVDLELSVSIAPLEIDEENVMYYNALFYRGRYTDMADRMPDYVFLNAMGEGRFVGVNLHLYKSSDYKMDKSIPGHNWWGEGDEKFFVDGEKFPSWFGTGTEDFFGYAWCDPTVFTAPYHGQSYTRGGTQLCGNRVVTRIFLADSVGFEKSFEGCLEKYYSDEHVKYAFVSHVYLKNGAKLEKEAYSNNEYLDYFNIDK